MFYFTQYTLKKRVITEYVRSLNETVLYVSIYLAGTGAISTNCSNYCSPFKKVMTLATISWFSIKHSHE